MHITNEMNKPAHIVFKRSTQKDKKYQVDFTLGGKQYRRHFGHPDYQHYHDRTPLRVFSHLDHNDLARRRLYYARHKRETNPLSARYWANKYLW